jgi:putative transposase
MLNVLVHFVWATWDRLPLISPEIEVDLYHFIHAVCDREGCPVVSLGGTEDHIHLLVALSNTTSMADLMEAVKGASSRFISDKLRPGEWFKWQGSYGAFSVSARDRKRVIEYIRNQKQHHAVGSLWREAEKTHLDTENVSPATAGEWSKT